MYLSEVVRLTQNIDSFRLDWTALVGLIPYVALPMLGLMGGALVAKLSQKSTKHGAVWGLAAVLGVAATSSMMIWIDGEATLVSRRWRFLIGLTPAIGLPILALLVHRWRRPNGIAWVKASVVVWSLSVAGTRILRDLALDLYNFRWWDLAGGFLYCVFLLGCALVCWFWLGLLVRKWRRALLYLGMAALAIPLCLTNLGASKTGTRSAQTNSGDVFLIILDSLRGDHASPSLMPTLAAMARRGTQFVDAHSPSINTTYSLPVMLNRKLDSDGESVFRTRFNVDTDDFAASLPGQLRRSGYEIHLLSDYAHTSLKALEVYLWDSVSAQPTFAQFRLPILPKLMVAYATRDRAAMKKLKTGKFPFGPGGFADVLDAHLRAAKGPGFYLIHLAVPHSPYNLLPYRTRTLPSPSEKEMRAINDRFRLEGGSGAQVDVAGRKAMYKLAVRAGDEQLDAILQTIEKRGRSKRSLVVVSSDHGEPFGEHGSVGHGRSLYNSAHHIPLVITGPGFDGGQIIRTPVSGAQIPSTILEWTKTEPPSEKSLFRDLNQQKARPLAVWHPRGTVVQNGSWRLIWTEQRHVMSRPKSWSHRTEFELYNLAKDSEERRNLIAERPPALTGLLNTLESHWLIPDSSRAALRKRRHTVEEP
ncbi:MAG: sulfatase-like hydrolase/transferase [Myxococcota bacterium]|nr:sulfatase-like hydrolase/transferase [Myxococcota bacterium]